MRNTCNFTCIIMYISRQIFLTRQKQNTKQQKEYEKKNNKVEFIHVFTFATHRMSRNIIEEKSLKRKFLLTFLRQGYRNMSYIWRPSHSSFLLFICTMYVHRQCANNMVQLMNSFSLLRFLFYLISFMLRKKVAKFGNCHNETYADESGY